MTKNDNAIDLNADLGEGCPNDARLLEHISSASVACNAHAGSLEAIRATLLTAKARGVAVGAHPGFADRATFGRTPQVMASPDVAKLVADQVALLESLCQEIGLRLAFVKPHGALYNQARNEANIAEGILDAVRGRNLPILGQPGGLLERLAPEAGVRFIPEGFPDRRYETDGSLSPRTRPDAVLETAEEIGGQAVRLARQGLLTLCIHGDDPRAVSNAETVRSALIREGFSIRFWS